MTKKPNTEPVWNIKPKSPLDKFVKERGEYIDLNIREDGMDFYGRDKLTISLSYIKCVKLDEIKIQKIWSEKKRNDIIKWATPDNLCLSEHGLPELEIKYNLNSGNQVKFEIVDGIHRINRAKELGMKCIRAQVYEDVKVDKTDTKNITLDSNQSIE